MSGEFRAVIFGPPAIGKGKVAAGLVQQWSNTTMFPVFKYLKSQVEAGTPYGRRVEPLLAAGGLLPDEVVVDGIRQELNGKLAGGFILDGLPVNARQAELLHEALAEAGVALTAAIHLAMPKDEVLRRVGARFVCETCTGRHPVDPDPARPDRCPKCDSVLTRTLGDDPYLDYRVTLFEQELPALTGFYRRHDQLLEIDGRLPAPTLVVDVEKWVAARQAAAGRA